METIFDHKVTKEELKAITGFSDTTMEDLADWNQRDNFGLIYRLYRYRKDTKNAAKYAKLIPNDVHKMFGTCYHDFAI